MASPTSPRPQVTPPSSKGGRGALSPQRGQPGDADAKAKQGMHDKAGQGAKAWLKRQGMC